MFKGIVTDFDKKLKYFTTKIVRQKVVNAKFQSWNTREFELSHD